MTTINFSLDLKHARDAALQALACMNDFEFYQAHMPASGLSARYEAAHKLLAEAAERMTKFGVECGLAPLDDNAAPEPEAADANFPFSGLF